MKNPEIMHLKARALYDCHADHDSELSFKKGDVFVDVVETNEEGWLEGRKEGSNKRGFFPNNYVELFEEKKLPPKLPPRQVPSNNSNNIKSNSPVINRPPLAPKPSFELVNAPSESNDFESKISIGKPGKLSTHALAMFESNNNSNNSLNNNNSKNSDKKPKSKVRDNVTENAISKINQFIIEKPDKEVKPSPASVSAIKASLEGNAMPEPPLISPKPNISKLKETVSENETNVLPSQIKNKQKPLLQPKPTIVPSPPVSSKSSIPPQFPNRQNSSIKDHSTLDSKPPLPPRSNNNASSNIAKNGLPPPTPPRPSNTDKSPSTKPNLENYADKYEGKAKSLAKDQIGTASQKGVSLMFAQGKEELSNSKYGKRKIPGQDKIFNYAEDQAKKEANNRAQKSFDDAYADQKNSFSNNLKNINVKIPQDKLSNVITPPVKHSPPPLPSRKNTSSSTNSDIKIPRRPPQHNNPFPGIPSDARKRYEIVFDANKDDDGDYIDGAYVKVIYERSRLDNKTLHKIWGLLDTDKDGYLTRNEFCVGMFLIDERLRGNPVPDTLPEELLN